MRLTSALTAIVLMLALPAMGASSVKTNPGNKKWKTQKIEANLDAGCRFALELPLTKHGGVFTRKNPPRGGLLVEPLPTAWNVRGMEDLYFHLICLDADKVADGVGAVRFDPQTDTWNKDVDKRINALGYKLSPQEYRDTYADFDQSIRVYNVTAVNAKGYADTEADTTGDEKKRVRRMGFCLINRPKALCGSGVVGYVADGPKSDLSERVLEILRSVEFLEDEAPATEADAPPAPGTEP